MSTKESILKAHASMRAVLDAKLADMPEWQAFKAIDEALRQVVESEPASKKRPPLRKAAKPNHRQADGGPTYSELAAKALEAAGEPVTTKRMVDFIGQHKTLVADLAKARINVGSALSHDGKFQNIEWQGGRAWWWADKPIPSPKPTGLFIATPKTAA